MLTEGQLTISLKSQNHDQNNVVIRSSRPVFACQVLIGKTTEEALELIPRLFNLCGMAQSRAASLAINSNMNVTGESQAEVARDMLVLVETAREHLLQLMMKTPQVTDQPFNPKNIEGVGILAQQWLSLLFATGSAFKADAAVTATTTQLNRTIESLESLLRERVFHCATEEWLGITTVEDLLRWCRQHTGAATCPTSLIHKESWSQQGDHSCQPMGRLDFDKLEQLLSEDDNQFAALPQWQGESLETTTLSRNWDHPLIENLRTEFGCGLLTRWAARLVDLARIPQQLRDMSASMESNLSDSAQGISQVEAARGRLIHRVRVRDDRIDDYQIVAPTEWNFHPTGVVNRCLGKLQTNSLHTLDRLSRLIINSIDPCVGYQLRVQ